MTPEISGEVTPEAIKELTDFWVARQQRLVDKRIKSGENPVVAYSAAMGMCVNTLVNCILKFDARNHQGMITDMGKMIWGLYASKMEADKVERPRIILPSQLN